MRRLTLLIALAAMAGLSSCTDATGPGSRGATGTAQQTWQVLADRTGDGHGDSELHVLEHSTSAPPLERYRASFMACRGRSQALRIRYAVPRRDRKAVRAPDDHLFLELAVPRGSLDRRPDGRRFLKTDCVKISVEVDPTHLVAHLKPGGLEFNRNRPAQLRMWYADANPDFNGDGVVDRHDAEVRDHSLGIWRLPHSDDEPWHQIGAVHYRDAHRFEAELYEFSHYAVAH